MFRWYQEAKVCYAYLSDVWRDDDLEVSHRSFANSRWFTRGWTLQELIAPMNVLFYDSCWRRLGSKTELGKMLSMITSIPKRVLVDPTCLRQFSVAERMSWACDRQTTRSEDIAYSLLGIFDVNMPLLYGEGMKAFLRLQQEILSNSTDQSIFAWADTDISYLDRCSLLARSPAYFRAAHKMNLPALHYAMHYGAGLTMTNQGLQLELFLTPVDKEGELWKATFARRGGSKTSPAFSIYMVSIDGACSTEVQSRQPVMRRLARVGANFLDSGSGLEEGELQTVIVPPPQGGLDPIHIRDLSALPATPPGEPHDCVYSKSVCEVHPENVFDSTDKEPLPKRQVDNTAPRRASISAGATSETRKRSGGGFYYCILDACSSRFFRRIDVKIHQEFVHRRSDLTLTIGGSTTSIIQANLVSNGEGLDRQVFADSSILKW